ncbi:MAG: hypothetical protein AABW88_03565 [Nanoarchaeota archaeon]
MSIDEHFADGTDPNSGEPNMCFGFTSAETKEQFLENIANMGDKARSININKTTCGECAAYPCYRRLTKLYTTLLDNPSLSSEQRESFSKRKEAERKAKAGLCFQVVRKCRQECDHYSYAKYPADGGHCNLDSKPVSYEQECHVLSMMRQAKE